MSELYIKAKSRFDHDTKDHTMDVKMDNGVYRHLVFTKNGSSVYRYDLTTWPGYLCISGDMGCCVFSRIPDMFEFFRDKGINPHYWGEKIQAADRNDNYYEFSQEKFRGLIKDRFTELVFFDTDRGETPEEFEVRRSSVDSYLDRKLCDISNYDGAYALLGDNFLEEHLRLSDYFDDGIHASEYSPHYLWLLYAIVRGIEMYDKSKKVAK